MEGFFSSQYGDTFATLMRHFEDIWSVDEKTGHTHLRLSSPSTIEKTAKRGEERRDSSRFGKPINIVEDKLFCGEMRRLLRRVRA
jgi:hypothetical protein